MNFFSNMKNIFGSSDSGSFLNAVFLILFAAFLMAFSFLLGKITEKVKIHSKIKKGRTDAVKRSRAVLGGQMAEQIAPFLPDFPCNAADIRFIGKPVDFLAFPGMAEGKSIEEVLLIEIKTGKSQLSGREKEIKSLVERGKVRYVEYHFSADK